MLQHVGCFWLKFENGQIFHAALILLIFHDVVVVWLGLHNNVVPTMHISLIFNTQQCCDMLHSNVTIVCRILQMLGQQCWELCRVEILPLFHQGL